MAPLTSIFPIILTGLAVSLLASWPAAWLAQRLRLVDIPGLKAHKRHSSATPMGGGMALAAGLALGRGGIAGAFFLVAASDPGQGWTAAFAAGIVGACLGTFVFNMLPSK